jgi:hypothetical protein
MTKGVRNEISGVAREEGPKLNSRVTKAHIGQLVDAMTVALDRGQPAPQRLGYLSYAVASILKDVGLPAVHTEISKRMWANYGEGSTDIGKV